MLKKRITSFVMAIFLMTALFTNVSAANTAIDTNRSLRQMELFEMKADSIETECDLSVSNTKVVHDFSGNKYTVVECSPSGYFIYHDASGVFVESSPSAPSPYQGITDNLYYGGPTAYYQKIGNKYSHTVLDETIDISAKDILANESETMYQKLMSVKNSKVLNYIEKGTVDSSLRSVSATTSYTYIPYYSVLYRLYSETQMGYYVPPGSNGCCGYIGLGLMLLYADYVWNDGYINDSLYLDSTHAFTGPAFTQYLISIGQDLGYSVTTSYAHTIRNVNTRYLSLIGMNATHYQHTALPTDNTITGYINNGRPVLLLGSVQDAQDHTTNISHAVVIYGYTGSGSSLVYKVHYGWPGYRDIELIASLTTNGSAYAFAP